MLVGGFEGSGKCRHRRGGRDLSGGVASHAVGDCIEARRDQQLVLVVRADKADVGRRPHDQFGHLRSSSTVRPTCRRSPLRSGAGPVSLRPLTSVPFVEPRSSTQYSSPLRNTLA